MSIPQVMVVEDEGLVALELKETLKRLGYGVCAVASSGPEALEKAVTECPDLIIMDIRLDGPIDGIETATRLNQIYAIPVIYLTADINDKNLERVKSTESFGCILKPFDERTLRATIEISLAHAERDRKRKEETEWQEIILKNIGWGIIATDCKGMVTHVNSEAQKILSQNEKWFLAKKINDVISFVNDKNGLPEVISLTKAIIENEKYTKERCLLVLADKSKAPASYTISPMLNKNENTIGALLFFKLL